MKAKVIMPFKDKTTGKVLNTGAEIEVTPERLAEIKKAGNYVAEVKAETKAEKK